jgi:hypothetical protein
MNFPSQACEVFLSLRCNFQCEYCRIQQHETYEASFRLKPAENWIKALNGLGNVKLLRFAGGQPTHHPGFADIVNGIDLPRLDRLEIVCNGSQLTRDTLLQIKPRSNLFIKLSFHVPQIEDQSHISVTQELLKCHRNVTANLVALEEDETCYGPKKRIIWTYREDKQAHPPVDCLPACPPVGPSGDIFYCHSMMFRHQRKGVIGNIFEGWTQDVTKMLCPDVGFCHPLDSDHVLIDPEG